jgi:hypothetical protein
MSFDDIRERSVHVPRGADVPASDRGGNIPHLGYSSPEVINNLGNFVFKGRLRTNGMPDFTGELGATTPRS